MMNEIGNALTLLMLREYRSINDGDFSTLGVYNVSMCVSRLRPLSTTSRNAHKKRKHSSKYFPHYLSCLHMHTATLHAMLGDWSAKTFYFKLDTIVVTHAHIHFTPNAQIFIGCQRFLSQNGYFRSSFLSLSTSPVDMP